jgi:hypothetical protein
MVQEGAVRLHHLSIDEKMCENPRRHVNSKEYIILRYYPPRRQVDPER